MTRLRLTREQALGWNPDWSVSDGTLIEANLDRLNVRGFYVLRSNGYVGCLDAAAALVMTLHPGYIGFPKAELAPDDCAPDQPWLGLSTFRHQSPPTRPPRESSRTCPVHHVALPLTGICDECE